MPIPPHIHTIVDLIDCAADEAPAVTALRDRVDNGYVSWSYADLSDHAYRIGQFLAGSGVTGTDNIGIFMPNCRWWGAAFLGILSADATVIPLDTRLGVPELAGIISTAEMQAIIVAEQFKDTIESLQKNGIRFSRVLWIDTDMNDGRLPEQLASCPAEHLPRKTLRHHTAVIIFTSGTTGSPKGVMLSHGNLLTNAFELVEYLCVHRQNHSFVSILPLNHVFELTGGFISPLIIRAPVTYACSLRPDIILQTIRESHTSVMMVVPVFLRLFLQRVLKESRNRAGMLFTILFKLSHAAGWAGIPLGRLLFRSLKNSISPELKAFICGGAPIEKAVIDDYSTLGITVLQGYGLTETSPVICVNSPRHNRPGTVGRPLPSLQVRITGPDGTDVHEGELWIRGPSVFKGYFRNPEATGKTFHMTWFRTGDIARRERAGYISIRGRSKDIIVTDGGKNIYPDEIEAVLVRAPAVADVCVVGMHESRGGEKPVAVVVTTEDSSNIDMKNLYRQIHAQLSQLAEYKRPRRVYRWESLPKTSTLKTKRTVVRQTLADDGDTGLIHG
jgi:long-chain acyl-CoA synthetase